MIQYRSGVPSDAALRVGDFFEGWPRRPGQERFLAALHGSDAVEVALFEGAVMGFDNTISDGVVTAFIPWLEVVLAHRGGGRAPSARSAGAMYSIDLVCGAQDVSVKDEVDAAQR